ncbi:MAG: fatty acid desaturase [Planctomycetales bacterium]|nr:fatty acid desaturase [Planctomycetales bacterium]
MATVSSPSTRQVKPQPQEKGKDSGKPAAKNQADMQPTLVSWPVIAWLGIIHIGALFAFVPYFFSWQALAVTVFLHWLTGCVGVCLGFHRYLTHASFSTYPVVRWALAFIGGLAGEGSAIDWIANHRKHHALSDQTGDPHSPHDGPWWAHAFWLGWKFDKESYEKHISKWAPDLARDPVMRFLGTTFLLWHFVAGAALMGAGYALGGWQMGWSFLVWGVFVRLTAVLHTTWFVNSASHMWGYRNYETTDDSRNLWWVAIIAYGEGWHNNHHAYPRMAPHGHRWWEFDMTYNIIRLMKACGLAWNIVDYKTGSEKAAPIVPKKKMSAAEAEAAKLSA